MSIRRDWTFFHLQDCHMASIRQHYALTSNDRILSFDESVRYLRDSSEEERCYCPGCNREVHLSLSAHSFIHNTSQCCNYESYIRILEVLMLHERFKNRTKDFMIGTKRKVLCRKYKTCQFYSGSYDCWGEEMKRYNLKKIYDTCDYSTIVCAVQDNSTIFAL